MKRKNSLTIVLILASLLGIYLLDSFTSFNSASKIAAIIRPVGTVFSDIGNNFYNSFASIGNIGKLQKENKELQERLNSALNEIASLSESKKENDSLKRELGFKQNSNYNLQAASVVSFDPSNIRNSLLIDKGKTSGIKNGDIVTSEGFLVGRIKEVNDYTSKVALISDPESAIPSTVINSTISGITKGSIGSGLNLEQIPQSEKVSVGDLVLTSGLGGDYPKSIIIGKVDDIQKISGSIFQFISLRTMVDLNRLERVMVIIK